MDWSVYLEDGETMRWEGRPAPRCFTFRNWRHSLFGFLLLLPSVHLQIVAIEFSKTYDSLLIAWIPLPFLAVGVYLAVGHLVLARLEWEKVFYAVTDRRVLVMKGLFKQRLMNFPLQKVSYFHLKPLGEELGTLRIRGGEFSMVLSCIEYPRRITDLLEAAIAENEELGFPRSRFQFSGF
jgi:hypothetical protein